MSNFSSGRGSRIKNSLRRREASPTLASTRSERSLWARSYKNQPIPTIIGRRLMGQRFSFIEDSDEEEDKKIVAVEEEEEQQNLQRKKKRLPVFRVISDWDQFSQYGKGAIKSQRKRRLFSSQRCRSVQSLKLPKVQEQKRQEDQLRKKTVAKLTAVRDNNQFGQQRSRRSSSSYTQIASKVQSVQTPQFKGLYTEQIEENQAEQTKSVKLPNDKSTITSELQKIIVDELDEKKRKKEEYMKQHIESIIEQQKQEEQIDTGKLRHFLERFEEESEYLQNDVGSEKSSRSSHNNIRFSNSNNEQVHTGREISRGQIVPEVHEQESEKQSAQQSEQPKLISTVQK